MDALFSTLPLMHIFADKRRKTMHFLVIYIENRESAKNVLAKHSRRHYNKECITVRGFLGEIWP